MALFKLFKSKTVLPAPEIGDAELLRRARLAHERALFGDAEALCQEILAHQPDHLDALCLSADIAAKSGDANRALETYRKVLDLKPDHALAHFKCGNLLKDREQLDAALVNYDKAIALDPRYAHAFCNRGFVLERLKRWDTALQSYDSAVSLTPEDALAHYNRAGVLRELGRREDALAGYARAMKIRPDYFEAYCNSGFLLIEMKRWDEAFATFTKSIGLNPRFAPAHFGHGLSLRHLEAWEAALASFDRAIEIDPGYAAAHCSRGGLLVQLRQFRAARSSLDRAIALEPDLAEAYYYLGLLWAAVGQSETALANFDKAIALKPEHAAIHLSRADSLIEMKRFPEAIESFDRVIALNEEVRFVPGARLFAKISICDWSEYAADVDQLASGIEAGEPVSPPHQALILLDSPALHHAAARIRIGEADLPKSAGIPSRRPAAKTRIGYFSGEFFPHPVAVLMAEVFETHDRSKYEVVAFSYGAHSQDEFGIRLEKGVDRFIDVREKTDSDIASLAREMEIDIAVDLAGHTGRGRTGIFACRAAPLQVNYLGYAGTIGADYMDYIIADETVVPEGQERHYSEKILRLPGSFLPHDSSRVIASTVYTREQLGLPPKEFVYCCFNNSYKITPEVFDSWMRILSRAPNSILWLSKNNPAAASNLRRESLRRGVDPKRLIFADHMPSPAEHLARHRAADLFLDTRPYNAHATAIDALWAGTPLLTFPGSGFAARVAASLLNALQLPELIATSTDHYEDLAVQLAEDSRGHALLKEKLANNRHDSLLFDTPRFVKHLETGYASMLEKLEAKLPPDHIRVLP